MRHVKETSLLNGHECWVKVKICKILEWDEKPQRNKNNIEYIMIHKTFLTIQWELYDSFHSTSVYINLFSLECLLLSIYQKQIRHLDMMLYMESSILPKVHFMMKTIITLQVWIYILTNKNLSDLKVLAQGPYKWDGFTFDLNLTFCKRIYRGKVRLRPKVRSSHFYGPGARSPLMNWCK